MGIGGFNMANLTSPNSWGCIVNTAVGYFGCLGKASVAVLSDFGRSAAAASTASTTKEARPRPEQQQRRRRRHSRRRQRCRR